MKKEYELYFAYGSNLYKKQMKKRCRSSVALFKANKKNARICFPVKSKMRENMGVASIQYKRGSIVEGVVYQLTRHDMENLDKFEGNGKRYTRKRVYVSLNDNSKKLAWTYIAQTDSPDEYRPSVKYLSLIIKGAKEHKLSKKYIKHLTNFSGQKPFNE